MSKIGTIARRTFLIGSAAVVGGVAFGYYAYKTPADNPLLDDLKEGQAALTPYVRIDASGITLITPRADKGQGAYSVQAALIAEELDVELDQIKADPGPPSKAYYNTALAEESVPFAPTDQGFAAETSRGVVDAIMKFLGMQVTGGSTTVPDGFEKLRYAGAVARETLKAAASEQTGINAASLKTAKGMVILPDGQALSYESLAPLAAKIAPVNDVTLRDPSQWRLIGKPMQRIDVVPKSTGMQRYGIDFEIDGMVHAAIKLNPQAGGAVHGFDATEAMKMRGVHKVMAVTGGIGVLADNTWRAFQAAEAVTCEWGAAPFPAEQAEHWSALENSFTDAHFDNRQRDDGDTDAALIGADVVSAEYRVPYLAHAPLEPVNATVRVTDDRVDVWTGTQIPRFVQATVADMTGVDVKNVHVHVLMMGGSFGHRLEDDNVRLAVEMAMQVKGTPVKLTYSREEDMTHDYRRQIAMARGQGVVKEGQVETFDLGIAMPSIISSQMGRQGISVPGPDATIVQGAWEQPFAIPNYRVTGYRTPELAPISSWRSVGASSNGFFHESFLDELIHAAGADPLAERIRLCSDDVSRKVLETVGEMSNWSSDLGPNRGRGVAFTTSFGAPVAEVIEVTNTEDGIRIDKVYVAAEVGTVVDPVNFDNLVKGGVVFALGHAMNCEITFSDGAVEQTNYDSYEGMRMSQCPEIIVRALENGTKVRGIGEPPVPPAAPALANAIFAATGQRIREMPFDKHIDFT
ncbi:xanthine dehydrogenase family protein molybdopterin-binding subunit [Shimia litoralis]|uniref:Xanthine dehydrogenase family protein molybdopterin-binding subunit n=1 Tax=Shimia litoralis TaxID=420403 RepID=A0A4U7N8Q2_9RHOB|nr:molybdopterin cofactor-binding domain-containing protein [Shimia litoralis]TKZ22362.1 xanthine dehydrogenase family protein molybdopterin-binding subunit [Shimia litoralis]